MRQALCRAPLRREKVAPTAKLTTLLIPLRPTNSAISPLTPDRDGLPNNRTIHKQELTYELKAEEAGSYKPTLPMLNKCALRSSLQNCNQQPLTPAWLVKGIALYGLPLPKIIFPMCVTQPWAASSSTISLVGSQKGRSCLGSSWLHQQMTSAVLNPYKHKGLCP